MKTIITAIRSGGQSGVDRASRAGGIELCVGGPRASECPDAYQVTMEILEKVMELLDMQNI